jgi:hypothetical protein
MDVVHALHSNPATFHESLAKWLYGEGHCLNFPPQRCYQVTLVSPTSDCFESLVDGLQAPYDCVLETVVLSPQSPKHPLDALLLGAARSQADVILTTGGNLSAESDLRWSLGFDNSVQTSLLKYRQWLYRKRPSSLRYVAVLTRNPLRHLDHPALQDSAIQPILLTPSTLNIPFIVPAALPPTLLACAVDLQAALPLATIGWLATSTSNPARRRLGLVVQVVGLTPAIAVTLLKGCFDRVCIEAGPSVSRQLYDLVDTPDIVDSSDTPVMCGSSLRPCPIAKPLINECWLAVMRPSPGERVETAPWLPLSVLCPPTFDATSLLQGLTSMGQGQWVFTAVCERDSLA